MRKTASLLYRTQLSQKTSFFKSQHFNATKLDMQNLQSTKLHSLPHPVWSKEEVKDCPITTQPRYNFGDSFAFWFIKCLRAGFDIFSGYQKVLPWQSSHVSEKKWINRVIFLETVAGVPGFVAAMHRHLDCLRNLKRDGGWIHTLIEEAENERVHLLTFLNVKQPSKLFKFGVVAAQFWYVLLLSTMYYFNPRVCHRIVGYLEEEAVKTYTHCIEEIERKGSPIYHWNTMDAPQIAKDYWKLGEKATMRDVIYAVRKDEEHHKEVNHEFADDYTQQMPNPFPPGY